MVVRRKSPRVDWKKKYDTLAAECRAQDSALKVYAKGKVDLTAQRDDLRDKFERVRADRDSLIELRNQLLMKVAPLEEETKERVRLAAENRELRERVADSQAERWMFTNFMHDLQLITVAGTHMLCGSFWIRGESLLEAMRRYSDGDRSKT
jgi:hypothetical protein